MASCVLLRGAASARVLPTHPIFNRESKLKVGTARARGGLHSAFHLKHTSRAPINLRRHIVTAASGGYYKKVDGKKMDREMLDIAEQVTQGALCGLVGQGLRLKPLLGAQFEHWYTLHNR